MSLMKAVFNVQHTCPKIAKTNSNDFAKFKYADLGDIMEVLKPILNREGIVVIQKLTGNAINTVVCHVDSGERDEFQTEMHEIVKLSGMNNYQVDGSRITYYKKYVLISYFGLISDEAPIDSLPPQPSEPPKKTKRKLSDAQFDRLVIAIESKKELDLNDYEFTEEQKLTIKELKSKINEK